MMTDSAQFATLERTIASPGDHALALRHAPWLRFDLREPFLPSVAGYTVFREPGVSPSFPREIAFAPGVTTVIEYAIWWDWDIQHLYELEHAWVWLDAQEQLVGGEASWHGGQRRMLNEDGQTPAEDGRLILFSEPGKHAFAPSPQWLLDRAERTRRSTGQNAGRSGVLVTPLFEGRIHSRTPRANRAAHSYLECQRFEPTFVFDQLFPLEKAVLVPWPRLETWIPGRVAWWTEYLERTFPLHEQHLYVIAHRGASVYAPENSLEAFVKAAELGADLVEIDIRVTADSVPVVVHDETLDRLYGVSAAVADLTLAQLRALAPHGSAPVPTFEEVAAVCTGLEIGVYMDIKAVTDSAVAQIISSLRRHGMLSHSVAASVDSNICARFKAAAPGLMTSILFHSTDADPVALAAQARADLVHPCWERQSEQPHMLLTADWLARVRAAGLGIVSWHEERPDEIAALRALGIDMICSDTPDRVSMYRTICR